MSGKRWWARDSKVRQGRRADGWFLGETVPSSKCRAQGHPSDAGVDPAGWHDTFPLEALHLRTTLQCIVPCEHRCLCVGVGGGGVCVCAHVHAQICTCAPTDRVDGKRNSVGKKRQGSRRI